MVKIAEGVFTDWDFASEVLEAQAEEAAREAYAAACGWPVWSPTEGKWEL